MNTKRGFTIIELNVVIAIIAVLAGIVLVNVTQYINKGKDAAIKGNLSTLLTNSVVFFDENSSVPGISGNSFAQGGYAGVPSIIAAIQSANGNKEVIVNGDRNSLAWCAYANLTGSNDYFCVDSTGYKGSVHSNCQRPSGPYSCQ